MPYYSCACTVSDALQAQYKEAVAIAVAADWTANDYEGSAAAAAAAAAATAAAAAAAAAAALAHSRTASFFETTIRYVGGLLSAYAAPSSRTTQL